MAKKSKPNAKKADKHVEQDAHGRTEIKQQPKKPIKSAAIVPSDDTVATTDKYVVEKPAPITDHKPEDVFTNEATADTSRKQRFPGISGSLRRIYGRRMILAGIILLLLVGILQYAINRKVDVRNDAESTTQKLVSEVSKLAVLPEDEKPTISTVVDTSKLNQSFLLNAKNGDKVLLYFQAGKAYVYRPSTKQIVNIGPLTQPTSKVFIRNGTSAAATPTSIKDKLGQTSDYTIISQDTAINRKYPKTLVIDIAGNRPDIATRIARQIGGSVSKLPEGESPPEADFLIIAGADSL